MQLLPTAQLIQFSGRSGSGGFDFATDFSFPPAHLLTLLVPEFFGEPTQAGYWSVPNFEELAIYIGVVPILALILTLMIRPTKRSWFYIGLIVLGILLALGRYGFLYRLLFNWFPPFRVMRAPGRAMFFYVFAGSALVGELLYRLQAGQFRIDRERLAGSLRWLTILFGALGLVTVAAVGAVFAAEHPSDTSGRLWHQMGGWLWAFGGLALATWLLRGLVREEREETRDKREERQKNNQWTTDNEQLLSGHAPEERSIEDRKSENVEKLDTNHGKLLAEAEYYSSFVIRHSSLIFTVYCSLSLPHPHRPLDIWLQAASG